MATEPDFSNVQLGSAEDYGITPERLEEMKAEFERLKSNPNAGIQDPINFIRKFPELLNPLGALLSGQKKR